MFNDLKALVAVVSFFCFFTVFAEDKNLIIEKSSLNLEPLTESSVVGQLNGQAIIFNKGEVQYLHSGKWKSQKIDSLLAHTSIANNEQSIFLVGGELEGKASNKVYELKFDGSEFQVKPLQDLPFPISRAAAAYFKGALYLIGGVESSDENKSSVKSARLDFSQEQLAWEVLEDLPHAVHEAELVVGFQELLVLGGKVFNEQGASISTDKVMGFRLDPIDGQVKRGWRSLSSIPKALSNLASTKLGQSHIMLVGGTTITANGSVEPSQSVFYYHNLTDTWIEKPFDAANRSGAELIKNNGGYLLCGGLDSQGKVVKESLNLKTQRVVKSLQFLDYLVIVIYFIIMAGIGVFFAKKQDTAEEYALGNRGVKWWAAGISMFATAASSISFMAVPALIAATSLVHVSAVFLLIPAFFLSAYLTYPLLRRLKITSTFEYLERRFGTGLRILGSIQNISMQLAGRMSVVMLLPALAVSAVTGLDIMLSILLMGGLTTLYTCFGGFEAVIWSDVMQGGMMLIGLFIIGVLGIWALPDGVSTFVEVNSNHHKFSSFLFSSDTTLPLFLFFALATLINQMNFASDQSIAQRILCTPEKDVPKLAGTMTVCSIVVACLSGFAGLSLFAYFYTFPEQMDVMMKNDSMVPLFIVQEMPVGLVGLIIAALFAASMSTLSSSMNSCAVLISEDFYKRFSKKPNEKTALFIMKIGTFVMGAIGTASALVLSKIDTPAIMQIWTEICAVLMGGFVGVSILGLFTRRANCGGAIVGVIASIVVSLGLKYTGGIHWSAYSVFSTMSCCILGYLSSFIIPGKKRDLAGLTLWDMLPAEKVADTPEEVETKEA